MLKKGFIMVIIGLLFSIMTGCDFDKTDTHAQSKKPGKNEIRVTLGQMENIERLNLFVENVKNNKKDMIRLVRYTIEGDPIFHDLDFKGQKKLSLTLDTTKDKYGPGEIKSFTCKGIQKLETDKKTEYILTGCSNPQESELLTISHDVDKEDYFAFELKYGFGKKNKIDTRNKELIKEIQNGEMATVKDFQFSKEEMNKIYKLMVFSNFLSKRELSNECKQKPYKGYELTVWINSAVRHFEWSECDQSYDGKEMTNLVHGILKLLQNNADYKTLPDSKEGYK